MQKFFATAAALALASAAGAATVPASGSLAYDVIRKGKDIGDYSFQFTPAGKNLTVSITTRVAVKLPLVGITAYSFTQDSVEQWSGGKLAHLTSQTNDDGTATAIDIAGSPLIPASLWNSDLVHATKALNTIDGKKMAISVANRGAETVEAAGKPVQATHYSITGNLAREVWYDASGTLVRVAFAGADGSEILYVLK